jgi:hypothetical protein
MIKITRTFLLLAAFVFVLTFGLGLYIGKSGLATKVYRRIFPLPKQKQESYIDKLDSPGLKDRIRTKNLQEVAEYRQKLINIIWGDDGIPYTSLPDSISNNLQDTTFQGFNNLKQIDCLIDSLDYGFVSVIIHLIPEKNDRKEVVIYHHGHEGNDYSTGILTYKALVEKGFHVVILHMPLKGRNNIPTLNTSTSGKIEAFNHNVMMYLENPYPIFFTPIRTTINYLQKEFNINEFSMLGLSGGGWTTQLYAAMDTTIRKSYSIAGSAPIEIRQYNFEDLGDLEQYDPRIFSKISYPEIYILGAIGVNRRRIQILNKYDPCCFKSKNAEYYQGPVSEIIKSMNSGSYSLVVDSTHHTHAISEFARSIILEDLIK